VGEWARWARGRAGGLRGQGVGRVSAHVRVSLYDAARAARASLTYRSGMASHPNTAGRPAGIDPRGPRFAAAITSALLLIGTFLAVLGSATQSGTTFVERVADAGFLVLLVVALLFVWGFTSPATSPWSLLFRTAVRPRLAPPTDLEDPRPPRFAQVVGFVVVTIGLVLHVVGVPWALPIAGAAAFIAAFLNAAFGFCLGCQIYLALTRIGLIRPQGGILGGAQA